jgi:hypothetical protein
VVFVLFLFFQFLYILLFVAYFFILYNDNDSALIGHFHDRCAPLSVIPKVGSTSVEYVKKSAIMSTFVKLLIHLHLHFTCVSIFVGFTYLWLMTVE